MSTANRLIIYEIDWRWYVSQADEIFLGKKSKNLSMFMSGCLLEEKSSRIDILIDFEASQVLYSVYTVLRVYCVHRRPTGLA